MNFIRTQLIIASSFETSRPTPRNVEPDRKDVFQLYIIFVELMECYLMYYICL
jgi:hypothetical protein